MKNFESDIAVNDTMDEFNHWFVSQKIDELLDDLGPENTVGDLLTAFVDKAMKAVFGEELWNRTLISFEGKKGKESIDYKIAAAICSDEEMKEHYPEIELV